MNGSTLMGSEGEDGWQSLKASWSFPFDIARRVKFTGLAAYEAVSPQLEVWGIVANGWDDDVDNNKGKTGGLYGLFSPSLAAHVGLGVLYGPEKDRSEEHTSELQSHLNLVCRLLLEKKKQRVVNF